MTKPDELTPRRGYTQAVLGGIGIGVLLVAIAASWRDGWREFWGLF
jgi:hypothetical protein